MKGSEPSSPVLVVEDDLNYRSALVEVLQDQGYRVLAAATGQAALGLLEEHEPAVAVLDINLGDLSGLDVMRILKKRYPKTTCIILTGTVNGMLEMQAKSQGASHYFVKPIDLGKLYSIVRIGIEGFDG